MFALLKNYETVVLGSEEAINEATQGMRPHPSETWTLAYTDANEEYEVYLFERWEDADGTVWHICEGLRGIAEALTS